MKDEKSAVDLAEAIINFDEDFQGDPEAIVEVPFDVWAKWIDLAGKVTEE